MSKKNKLIILLACIATIPLLMQCNKGATAIHSKLLTEHAENRPNVVIILADDLGKYDLSLYGGLNIQTPHIDSIGMEGVTFDYAYATAPICAPSRAGLITGQYQQRFGFEFQPHRNYPNSVFEKMFLHWMAKKSKFTIQHNEIPPPKNKKSKQQGLTKQVPTLAEVLKVNGYKTGIFGKWHLGTADSSKPNNRGFDEQYGFYEAFSLYADKHRKDIVNYKHVDDFTDRFMWRRGNKGESRIRLNDSIIDEPEYLTFAIAKRAVKFIDQNKDHPFFMYVPFNAPHEPFQAPKKYYDKLSYIKDNNKRIYYAMIMALDDAVGMIMDELKKQGLDENTLVIFSSDNGAATYTGAVTNAPLKGGKFMNFEGGINIPYMMKWKGNLPAGKMMSMPISQLDIFATACHVANVNTDNLTLDGVNLMPYIKGLKVTKAHNELYWRSGYNYAAHIDNWKIIIDDEHQTIELYNLSKDRGENSDRKDKHPEIVARLREALKDWEKDKENPAWPWILNYKVVYNGETYYFAV